jgi:hypothetical protein
MAGGAARAGSAQMRLPLASGRISFLYAARLIAFQSHAGSTGASVGSALNVLIFQ